MEKENESLREPLIALIVVIISGFGAFIIYSLFNSIIWVIITFVLSVLISLFIIVFFIEEYDEEDFIIT